MTIHMIPARKGRAAVPIGPQSYSNAPWKPLLYLKSCPRCHGDLHHDRDHYGAYLQCVQCGFVCDLPDGTRPVAALAEEAPCWQKLLLAKAA